MARLTTGISSTPISFTMAWIIRSKGFLRAAYYHFTAKKADVWLAEFCGTKAGVKENLVGVFTGES